MYIFMPFLLKKMTERLRVPNICSTFARFFYFAVLRLGCGYDNI